MRARGRFRLPAGDRARMRGASSPKSDYFSQLYSIKALRKKSTRKKKSSYVEQRARDTRAFAAYACAAGKKIKTASVHPGSSKVSFRHGL